MYKRDPLETTVLNPFKRHYNDIKSTLEELYITDDQLKDSDYTYIVNATSGSCNVKIIGLTEANTNPVIKELSVFYHPIFIGDKDGELITFIDLRALTMKDGYKYRIRNNSEVELFVNYAILASYWYHDENEVNHLKQLGFFPAFTFVETVYEILNRLFILDPAEQIAVKVISSYYYNEVLFKTGSNDNVNMPRIAMTISKSTKVNTEAVLDILNNLDKENPIIDLPTLCKAIANVNELKLGRLSAPIMITAMQNIWFGIQAKERVAVAIEYPPLWITLCYAALNEASFKRTPLGKTTERITRITDAKAFVFGYNSALGLKTTER